MQYKGIYASKEENTEEKERIKEKRRLKARYLRNHEKKHRFKRVFSAYFKLAGMIPYVATNTPRIRQNRSFFQKR
jgi:hypothetical protein